MVWSLRQKPSGEPGAPCAASSLRASIPGGKWGILALVQSVPSELNPTFAREDNQGRKWLCRNR